MLQYFYLFLYNIKKYKLVTIKNNKMSKKIKFLKQENLNFLAEKMSAKKFFIFLQN